MPGGTLDYRLRIRTAADSADLVTYSTIPADGVYCAIKSAPSGDGQSLQPITGATQISSYDVDVIDKLLVANPILTTLDGFSYATNAAWNAAWTVELPPGTDSTSGNIAPNAPSAGTMELDWSGGGGVFGVSDQYYQRLFTGFTPGATYTVSVHVRNLGGYSIDGHQVLGVTGGGAAYMPVGGQGTVSAIAVADGSGHITVQIGVWQKGSVANGNLFVSSLTVQSGIAGQRIVTMHADDATGQPQLLGLKGYLEFSTDRGTNWLVLLAGYVNRARLTDAETYRFTIGQTRRADQTIRIFDTALGVFNAGSCILGGPIPGGWNGIQDYGPTRWKVVSVQPVGVLLVFVQGPFLSGRLPALMNMQYGQIGKGQLAYTNARAQQYIPARRMGLYPFGGGGGGFPISAPSALSARVSNATTGAAVGTFAPLGSAFQDSGIVLVPPPTQTIILAWTGTGVDQEGNAQPAQPSVGALYDLYVYPTAVSSDAPVHLAGHPVDIAAQVLTLAGLPYDAASATTTKAAVGPTLSLVLRITSGTTVKEFLSTLYGVFAFSTRSDPTGTLQFFSTNPATATVNGGTITVNSLRSDADDVWQQNDQTVVNRVSLVLRSFGLWSGDAGQSTPLDLVLAGTATATITDSDANNYGVQEQSWQLEGQIIDNVALGSGITFAVAPTTAASYALGRSQEIFRRVLRGAKEGEVHVLRSQDPGCNIGDLIPVDLPHRPAGAVRGGPRQVQIIQRTDDPAGPTFRFWDTGSTTATTAPVPTFTLAADANDPTHTADGTLTNAAALTAAGAVVRVEWGTGGSAPATGTLLVYLLAPPGALTVAVTSQVAAGTTVWMRMRAEVPGLAPGAFTSWASVTLGSLSAISGLTATAIDGTSEKLTWTNSDTTTPVVVFLSNWGVGASVPVVYLPPGSTSYTLHGLTPSTPYTATVRLQESASSFGSSASVNFTTAGTTPTLSAPTQPSAYAGTPDPNTGVVMIDGTFGIQVRANDGDAPGVTIVVQVAVETAVGSGTPGTFSDAGSGPAVLSNFTRVTLPPAPNDGKLRYLQARETRANYTDSSESTPVVSVNPWAAVPLPPTGTLQPVTVDDETAAIPNSRQLMAGVATTINTATAGKIKVDVTIPYGYNFGFGNGLAPVSINQGVSDVVGENGNVTAWQLWTEDGVNVSASVDIQVSAATNPPSWSSLVGAGTKPNLSGARWAQVTSITGWTGVAITAGQLIRAVLSTADGVAKTVRGFLTVTRT